jgi:acyl carrier protein
MTIDKNTIHTKVAHIIAEQLSISQENLDPHVRLENLGADSLDQVEIIMKLEEEFDTEISDQDAEKLVTLDDAVNYIYSTVSSR